MGVQPAAKFGMPQETVAQCATKALRGECRSQVSGCGFEAAAAVGLRSHCHALWHDWAPSRSAKSRACAAAVRRMGAVVIGNDSETGLQEFKHNGCELVAKAPRDEAVRLADALERRAFNVASVFKDDRRTYIARIEINGQDCIYKVPRGRNKRRWERLLTLFREGETFRHFRSMAQLIELGFRAPEPVLAAQRRSRGMVVDSWLLYRFVEGEKAGPGNAGPITHELLRLHEMGYLRRDPHAKNYLVADGGIVFVDSRLTRPRVLNHLRTRLELAKYLRTTPEGWDYLPDRVKDDFSLRAARRLALVITRVRRARRGFKAMLSRASGSREL